jgi:hypothetical protein
MKWNREEVAHLLSAEICDEETPNGERFTTVHFKDPLMRFELWILEGKGLICFSGDPERPMQALPLFEISLPCSELAPCRRGGMPVGLGVYTGNEQSCRLLFTITRRDDGYISLSGVWDGLFELSQKSIPPLTGV